ncbi:hypothetical protein CPAR01_10555 [Colletotrichum paranaense]|uniref:Uncharacterized protein n=1 Tax=Colletotrichum paranaense TaxID=1914294 RepID=A0ABQ9SEB6_9PEZI|nr:uncharacterized protein CPAR01_10555 [Colletotrichum paranaense]KAK1533847.1 hypothetical protein CPAR01_10555 [Colletotrichum paranaense]
MRINNRDRQTHTADGLPRQGWTWTWRGVTTRTTLSVSVSLSICYHPLFLSLSLSFAFLTPLFALLDTLSASHSLSPFVGLGLGPFGLDSFDEGGPLLTGPVDSNGIRHPRVRTRRGGPQKKPYPLCWCTPRPSRRRHATRHRGEGIWLSSPLRQGQREKQREEKASSCLLLFTYLNIAAYPGIESSGGGGKRGR